MISITTVQTAETSGIGVLIGFLGGLFGKGGSAVATPLLSLIGLPGYIALASPLPATAPSTLIAAAAYWRARILDWEVVMWGIGVGIPATIAGALLSRRTGAPFLLIITALLVLGFGLSFLLKPAEQSAENGDSARPSYWRIRMVAIAAGVGLISGLLANSGGFLLAPLYARVLKLRLKTAFACSLLVSAVLALPGTLVHWYLGHISWPIAVLVALGSIPFAYLGASVALKTRATKLEKWYGLALTVLGVLFLFYH